MHAVGSSGVTHVAGRGRRSSCRWGAADLRAGARAPGAHALHLHPAEHDVVARRVGRQPLGARARHQRELLVGGFLPVGESRHKHVREWNLPWSLQKAALRETVEASTAASSEGTSGTRMVTVRVSVAVGGLLPL